MQSGRATKRRPAAAPAFVIVLAAIGSFAPSARARAPAPGSVGIDDREAQRAGLYREATKAAGAGRWAEAKERLRAVLAIRSSPKVLFSLAQTEEQLGQLASAQADYARALERAAIEGKGDVVQAAGQAQRALSARVPHVRAVVSSGVDPVRPGGGASGASATLDDQPVALGTAVAIDPGDHRLVVSAPGMRAAILSVKVNEGQQLDLSVVLEPDRPAQVASTPPSAPAGSPAPPAPPLASAPAADRPQSSGAPLRTAGLVTIGIGIMAVGVGAGFGAESMWKHVDAQKACPGATCASASGESLWHDAVTSGDISTVAFVAGGAALVGGAILWLAAPRPNAAGTQIGVGPGSVQLRGAW